MADPLPAIEILTAIVEGFAQRIVGAERNASSEL